MLRASALVITALLSLQAAAAAKTFDFVPATSEGQKDLREELSGGDFKSALKNWQENFSATKFAQTQNGVATWSYMLLQNGMPYLAFETLLTRTQPVHLDKGLLNLWTTELRNSVLIQKGLISTRGGWKQIVDNNPVHVRISKNPDIARAFARASALSTSQINERARIWWQIATQAPQINQVDSSLRALKLIRESGQTAISHDMLDLTQGRVLYQKGDLQAALQSFEAIPKGSDLWVEAMEERAWSHLKMDDYDSALGDITTAISPALTQLAGPETFFLANLMSYKVCDYPRLFNTSELFKKRHKARLNEMQDLAAKGTSKSLEQVIARFDADGVSQEAAGPLVALVPQETYRDSQVLHAFNSRHVILNELKRASSMGLNDTRLEQVITDARNEAERFKTQGALRMRALAQIDVKEYRTVLNKMHILEGEVIQRLSMDDSLKGPRSKVADKEDTGDVLVFPVDKNEVWMDELGSYKASVKDCPTAGKGASL